jgi:large subunit ribosomal protein L18
MINNKQQKRLRRKAHIRKTVIGSAQKPRIFVFKSNKFIHTGVADDAKGVVVLGGKSKRTMVGAVDLAKDISKKLKAKKIEGAVFDRAGYKYHGIIAKYADSLRENGINI